MSNFTITSPTPPALPRFEGDFQLAPNNHTPTTDEQAYVAAVNAAVDMMAKDEADDAAANYPEALLAGRRAARGAAVSALKVEASNFVEGQNPASDPARVIEIRGQYQAAVPKFGAVAQGSDGDFKIVFVPRYAPARLEEQAFLDAIRAAQDELATDKRADDTPGFSPSVVKARIAQRTRVGELLRDQVNNFWTSTLSQKAATEAIFLTRGEYQAHRDRLNKRLFNVKSVTSKDSRSDLDIRLFSGLPPPDDKPSPDKQDLYVQINQTMTVIRTVCDRIRERGDRGSSLSPNQSGLTNWLNSAGTKKDTGEEADLLYAEFMGKIEGIAIIGLELEFTALAKLVLAELRTSFFVRAAGRIKNMHVNQLALGAAMISAILLATYGGIKLLVWSDKWTDTNWAATHSNFLLAACGAAIGTWASFAVRQVQYSFDDLVMVEESALKPWMRILFVMTLTMAACMLFWNGAINIEIGDLKTNGITFRGSGTVALLIGLFAGISERTLATAIAGRAAALVRGIGAAG